MPQTISMAFTSLISIEFSITSWSCVDISCTKFIRIRWKCRKASNISHVPLCKMCLLLCVFLWNSHFISGIAWRCSVLNFLCVCVCVCVCVYIYIYIYIYISFFAFNAINSNFWLARQKFTLRFYHCADSNTLGKILVRLFLKYDLSDWNNVHNSFTLSSKGYFYNTYFQYVFGIEW